ncbi:MAG TPA: DMT family transporter [candidate division Zixibacteria bacterium]|nr:DMT family transporter [candidate division Zixibacteria bacterium]
MRSGIFRNRSPAIYAYLALIVGLLSIAFSGIFIRAANAPGTVTAFYRMAIAAVVVTIPFLWQQNGKLRSLPRAGVVLALLGGLLFALDLAFWATGIDYSGATKPTLMANTAPLWVGLGSMLIFRERLGRLFWFGLALALFGAAMVLGADLLNSTVIGFGTFLGLLAAIFYGAYYLVTQRGRFWLNTLSYFWITTASASIVLLFLNLLMNRSLWGYDRSTLFYFLAIGLVVQLLGWSMINYAQGYLRASVVAPTLLLQPVVTAVLAVLLLGETFSAWHIIGGLIVLAGVYVVHRSRSGSISDNLLPDRQLPDEKSFHSTKEQAT